MFGAPASGGSFSFGNSKPAFSFNSTPAFSGTSTPSFGVSSTPAFGASSASAFGATPGGFGFGAATGASSSAFSFPASTPAFGAASQPAFGAASQAGLAQTPGFGASAPAFGQLAPFSGGNSQQPQQQQGQQHQLFAKNGQPITDSTQWDDIHEDSQRNLLQLECVS